MNLILVIEPDVAQATMLSQSLPDRVGAELVLASTADGVAAALNGRAPDVLLVGRSVTPEEQRRILAQLQSVVDTANLQTLEIPELRSPDVAPRPSRFSFRKSRPVEGTGWDPTLFAEQIGTCIDKARKHRAVRDAVAEPQGTLPDPVADTFDWRSEPQPESNRYEPEPASEPAWVSPAFQARAEEGLTLTAPDTDAAPQADWFAAASMPAEIPDSLSGEPRPPESGAPKASEWALEEQSGFEDRFVPIDLDQLADMEQVSDAVPLSFDALASSDASWPRSSGDDDPAVSATDTSWPASGSGDGRLTLEIDTLIQELGIESAMVDLDVEAPASELPDSLSDGRVIAPGEGGQVLDPIDPEVHAAELALVQELAELRLAAELERVQAAAAEQHALAVAQLQAQSTEQHAKEMARLEAAAAEQRARELARIEMEAAAQHAREMARLEAEAAAAREAAVSEARAAAQAEARTALAVELAAVRSEAEEKLASELSRVRAEAEHSLAAEIGRTRAEADQALEMQLARAQEQADAVRAAALDEARAAAEATAARALAAEAARVRADTEARLDAELARVRHEAEQARLAQQQIQIEAERLREDAAREARAAAEQAAARALEVEMARVKAEADARLDAELARVRQEAEQMQRLHTQDQLASTQLRDAAAREARQAAEAAAAAAIKAEVARVRAEADARLEAELARVRGEAEQARSARDHAQFQSEQVREAASRAARDSAEQVAARVLAAESVRIRQDAEARLAQESERARADADARLASEVAAFTREAERRREVEMKEIRAQVARLRDAAAQQARSSAAGAAAFASNVVARWRPEWQQVQRPLRALQESRSARIAAGVLLVAVVSVLLGLPGAVRSASSASLQWLSESRAALSASPEQESAPAQAAPAAAPPAAARSSAPSTPVRRPAPAASRPADTSAAAARASSGFLRVFSRIPVDVYVGSRRIGTSDEAQIVLGAGWHSVRVVSNRFNFRDEVSLEVRPGDVTAYTVTLPAGQLRVHTTAGAEVWVEGERAGAAPLPDLQVPIGTREVVVRHPELGTRRAMVEVKNGLPASLTLTLERNIDMLPSTPPTPQLAPLSRPPAPRPQ